MHYIYLHGFASSPNSAKAQDIGLRFAQIHTTLKIPDLNLGDFYHLTITRQLKQVVAEFPPNAAEVTLIGSSLGGLTAAHLGQQYLQVQRLVLLAPAFGFLSHWLPNLGDEKLQRWQEEKYLEVYHYGEKRCLTTSRSASTLPLHHDFVTDAAQYQEGQLQRPIPTLILHGKEDEVIPIQASRDFACLRPWVELIELDSDHALGNQAQKFGKQLDCFVNCHKAVKYEVLTFLSQKSKVQSFCTIDS